jgi:hypothetical protein
VLAILLGKPCTPTISCLVKKLRSGQFSLPWRVARND